MKLHIKAGPLPAPIEKESANAQKCTCREPKRSLLCAYCGTHSDGSERVCGVCAAQVDSRGNRKIDGPVIRGTERRICPEHR